MILDIITHAEDEQYQDNLLMVKDAYLCLSSVVAIGKNHALDKINFIRNYFEFLKLFKSILKYFPLSPFQVEKKDDLLSYTIEEFIVCVQ